MHSLWVGTGHVENKLLRIFSHQGFFSMIISLIHKATNSVGFGKYLQIVSLIFKLHSKSIIFFNDYNNFINWNYLRLLTGRLHTWEIHFGNFLNFLSYKPGERNI